MSRRTRADRPLTHSASLFLFAVSLLLLLAGTASCSRRVDSSEKRIAVSLQYGLAYAPVQIMKEMKLIEREDPEIAVSWVQLENTAAIREAMVAGRLDIGFGGIPPFLVGLDSGMRWKIAVGLSSAPLGLVVREPHLRSLEDFTPEDRIIVPQPGSIQHILLAMALERERGDARLLDANLISMAHPDGMQALLSGAGAAAHFTAPPYLFTELEQEGFRQILSGEEAMGGPFTFIVGTATEDLYENRPEVYDAFIRAAAAAVAFIRDNPQEAAEILAAEYGIEEETLYRYLTYPGMEFSSAVSGVMEFGAFMVKHGFIDSAPGSVDEAVWGVR
jgi:NitT/TauT family transport system substrate-binding protein